MKKKTVLRLLALLTACAGLLTACGGTGTPGTESSAETPPTSPDTPSTSAETPPPVTDRLNVWCFQAGKADAFLLWNSAGAVLIDAGESGFGKTILAKLEELGLAGLDCLILTHFDKDHVGGAKKLLNSIPVGTVLQSNFPKTGASAYENYLEALEENGITPVTVRESLSFFLGDVLFTVNPPARELYPEEESNNSSLIVSVTHGSNRLLFLADAMELRLSEFLASSPGPADFVKLPHHGSWLAGLQELLERTGPRYALITCSEDEPEAEQTLELLSRSGVQTFLTRQGPVLLTSDGAGLTASYGR